MWLEKPWWVFFRRLLVSLAQGHCRLRPHVHRGVVSIDIPLGLPRTLELPLWYSTRFINHTGVLLDNPCPRCPASSCISSSSSALVTLQYWTLCSTLYGGILYVNRIWSLSRHCFIILGIETLKPFIVFYTHCQELPITPLVELGLDLIVPIL